MAPTEAAPEARILIITPDDQEHTDILRFLGRDVTIHTVGCGGDTGRARQLIENYDGRVDAIGLDRLPLTLRLNRASMAHPVHQRLAAAAQSTPVVDGSGICAGLERWGVILADRAQPGIFAEKHILMMPGLNHTGLTSSLMRHTRSVRYADPVVFFGLPEFPGMGSRTTLEQAAAPILETLCANPSERLFPLAEPRARHAYHGLSRWADVLAGDAATIRRFGADRMDHKTVVVDYVTDQDIADLTARGTSIVVTMMPSLIDG